MTGSLENREVDSSTATAEVPRCSFGGSSLLPPYWPGLTSTSTGRPKFPMLLRETVLYQGYDFSKYMCLVHIPSAWAGIFKKNSLGDSDIHSWLRSTGLVYLLGSLKVHSFPDHKAGCHSEVFSFHIATLYPKE